MARFYAATYPDEVVGLVLVDAYTELLEDVMSPEQWQALVRLNQELGSDVVHQIPGYGDAETTGYGANNAAMREAVAASPLPPMPLAVFAHGKPFSQPADAPGFAPGELERFCGRRTRPGRPGPERALHRGQRERARHPSGSTRVGDRSDPAGSGWGTQSGRLVRPGLLLRGIARGVADAVTPGVATPASARSITYARLAGKQEASRSWRGVSQKRSRPLKNFSGRSNGARESPWCAPTTGEPMANLITAEYLLPRFGGHVPFFNRLEGLCDGAAVLRPRDARRHPGSAETWVAAADRDARLGARTTNPIVAAPRPSQIPPIFARASAAGVGRSWEGRVGAWVGADVRSPPDPLRDADAAGDLAVALPVGLLAGEQRVVRRRLHLAVGGRSPAR